MSSFIIDPNIENKIGFCSTDLMSDLSEEIDARKPNRKQREVIVEKQFLTLKKEDGWVAAQLQISENARSLFSKEDAKKYCSGLYQTEIEIGYYAHFANSWVVVLFRVKPRQIAIKITLK